MFLLFLLFLLNFLDYATTLEGITRWGLAAEANPIMKEVFKNAILVFFVKLIFVPAFLIAMLKLTQYKIKDESIPKMFYYALYICNGFYIWLMMNNIDVLMRGIK